MDESQEALLAYVMTIAEYVRGSRSKEEFLDRLIDRVKMDGAFIAKGFIIEGGRRLVEKTVVRGLSHGFDLLADLANDFITPTTKKKTRR